MHLTIAVHHSGETVSWPMSTAEEPSLTGDLNLCESIRHIKRLAMYIFFPNDVDIEAYADTDTDSDSESESH